MRIRNKTGVPQSFDGFSLYPGRWYNVPEQIPFRITTKAWESDVIEWDFGKDNFDEGYLWTGLFAHGSGYGTSNENLMKALRNIGVNLDVQPLFPSNEQHIRFDKEMGYHKVGCCYAVPDFFSRLITPIRVGFTMCESTNPLGKRPEWRHGCNQVDKLVVPSQFCKDVFGKFYKGPIDIVGLPLSQDFSPIKRTPKETFTFATYGVLSLRKSPLETIELFKKTFPARLYPDVRLEIKTRLGLLGMIEGAVPAIDDYRIKVINEDWTRQRLVEWLHNADCLLFLTKGEGYGMPPREALCTGMPVIATDTSGLKDLSPYIHSVPVLRQEDAPIGGKWDIPDWERAGYLMKQVYEERDYNKAYESAQSYLKENAPEKLAQRMLESLETVEPLKMRKRAYKERPSLRHKPFFDLIKGDVIWDIGIGDGVAYTILSKLGKKVYGIVKPGEKAQAEKTLRKYGVEPRIKECSLVNIDKTIWPKPDCIMSLGYFQNISPREVNQILSACYRVCKEVVFGVPTVYHPGKFTENVHLLRRPAWEDYLDSVAVECRYYGKGDRYMRGKVVGKRTGNPQQGRRTGDTWRPVDNTCR